LAATYRVDLENYDWADDRQAAENRCMRLAAGEQT